MQAVQTFGKKVGKQNALAGSDTVIQKTATAVAHCKNGKGAIRVNGVPLEFVQPETLRLKAFEPILILGKERFAGLDIRIRVKGGGHTSQIYGKSACSFFIII